MKKSYIYFIRPEKKKVIVPGGFDCKVSQTHRKSPQVHYRNIKWLFTVSSRSERGTRRGGSDGQREAQEGAEAPDYLLQLPAGSPAEEIPVGTVPGPAGAGRAGRAAGPHTDTGEAAGNNIQCSSQKYSTVQ